MLWRISPLTEQALPIPNGGNRSFQIPITRCLESSHKNSSSRSPTCRNQNWDDEIEEIKGKKLRTFCISLFIAMSFLWFQSHFESNPNDLGMLRHDKALHTVRLQSHLKDVPDYIIPPTLRRLAKASNNKSRAASASSGKKARTGTKEKTFLKRKDNPLLSFEFGGFKKKAKK